VGKATIDFLRDGVERLEKALATINDEGGFWRNEITSLRRKQALLAELEALAAEKNYDFILREA
jgi:MoxR-like ATPase